MHTHTRAPSVSLVKPLPLSIVRVTRQRVTSPACIETHTHTYTNKQEIYGKLGQLAAHKQQGRGLDFHRMQISVLCRLCVFG